MSPKLQTSVKPSRPNFKTAVPQTYTSLRTAVRQAIALGKERAVQAVEREKVRTSWEIGKLILDHVLLNKDRADYGAKVVEKLSKDLGVSLREVQYMVEFARTYPIVPTSAQLSWSHYRELLSVNESQARKKITNQAVQNNWNSRTLRSEIKKLKVGSKISKKAETLPEATIGKPGVYRTLKWRGKWVYDLGFSTYLEIKGKRSKKAPRMEELYFYEGVVDRVVDGDTVLVDIHLGFGIWSYQRLRLAKINAPELSSQAGINAKRYLSRKIKKGSEIIIATTKSDKFDRYLADVYK